MRRTSSEERSINVIARTSVRSSGCGTRLLNVTLLPPPPLVASGFNPIHSEPSLITIGVSSGPCEAEGLPGLGLDAGVEDPAGAPDGVAGAVAVFVSGLSCGLGLLQFVRTKNAL